MKVVLFCGGLGMRLREYSENVPKPMVVIGQRPILWHLMKYYAHFGHKEFILCLGHGAGAIKDFFLTYEECVSNDFVLPGGGGPATPLRRDIDDWRITFVDTGIKANVGQRLLAVREHLEGEGEFLANYSDGLTDLRLPDQIRHFQSRDKVASFLAVSPSLSYHLVSSDDQDEVVSIRAIGDSGVRINGGFFIFRQEIFDYLRKGEDLVAEPFERLIRDRRLLAYRHDGFWLPMDTAKDKQRLDDLYQSGNPPWALWRRDEDEGASRGKASTEPEYLQGPH
jgi:glucose-1-phosphate cytidylyltransferase